MPARHTRAELAIELIEMWTRSRSRDMIAQQDCNDGRTRAPAGRFLAVSAGGEHSCGARIDSDSYLLGSKPVRRSRRSQTPILRSSRQGPHQ